MKDDFCRIIPFDKRENIMARHPFERLPETGQRVVVDYSDNLSRINTHVWWNGVTFVNKHGFELYNIRGWKEYNQNENSRNI